MKHLIVAVLMATMAVFATEVRANNITYSGSLFPVNPIVALHSPGSFSDTFTFSPSGPGSFTAPVGFNLLGSLSPGLTFNSVILGGHALSLSGGNHFASNSSPFSFSGSLILTVAGTAGLTGGSYGGALTAIPGSAASVPEPASLLLLGAGLAAIGIWKRKSRKI